MIRVGIVGATGYTGSELIRLLSGHPQVQITALVSRSEAGKPIASVLAHLHGLELPPLSEYDPDALAKQCEVLFLAGETGFAMEHAPTLLQRGVKVIDLSADFRLKDPALFAEWYGKAHTAPELLREALYGLPELTPEDAYSHARLIANPGCYPTAVQLGFLPLIEAGVVDTHHLIADAKSGVSGAGRKAEVHTLLAEAGDNFKAYGVAGHRHLPEIRQGLSQVAGHEVGLTFVPHLTPMIRGIHATLYARLIREVDLQALYEERYRNEPFVDVLPPGAHPETRSVRAGNVCRIAVHRPQGGDTVVVLSVIDNLVKGASGQAIQNMNILFGLPERLGLDQVPVLP